MGGGGNNRRADNRFDRGGFGGGMNRPNPWGGDNMGGNFRQGGGNNGGMNNDVLSLANSLVNNLLRNQNHPPSLLDLPNRGGYGGGRDGRFNDRMGGVSVFSCVFVLQFFFSIFVSFFVFILFLSFMLRYFILSFLVHRRYKSKIIFSEIEINEIVYETMFVAIVSS